MIRLSRSGKQKLHHRRALKQEEIEMGFDNLNFPQCLSRFHVLSILAAVLFALSTGCNANPSENGDAAATESSVPNIEETKGVTEIMFTPEAVSKYGIRVELAAVQTLTPTFVAPAKVAFDNERVSFVGSAVTGRVAELNVRIGDAVNKGDVLIVVDSPEFASAQADHLQKLAGVAAATPLVDLTRSAYDRVKKLFDDSRGQITTLTEVQKRESEYRAAEGNVRLAQAALAASINRLEVFGLSGDAIKDLENGGRIDSRFVIRSPIAGQVIERPVTLGELIRPDSEFVIMVADLSTMWVLADVPEFRLQRLFLGSTASIKTDDGASTLVGTVSYLPPQLDASTRTAQVRIEVNNPVGSLRAGAFTQVEIAEGNPDVNAAPTVAIPYEAVQTIDGKTSIFVPVSGKDHTFVQNVITIGPNVRGMVPIIAGLMAGQPFVSSGTFIFKAELGKLSVDR